MRIIQQFCLGMVAVIALSACGGSGSSGGSNNQAVQPGSLSFSESSIAVTNGSSSELILSLNNSANVNGLQVAVSSSDTNVATVTPANCSLSSGPGSPVSCEILVHGVTDGNVQIIASAAGYANATSQAAVSNSVVAGSLSFDKSSESITVGSNNHATLSLNNSSGVTDLVVSVTSSNPGIVTTNPTSCTLSSGLHRSCELSLNGVASGSATLTASASGYTDIVPLAVNVSTTTVFGSIAFNSTNVQVASGSTQPVALVLSNSSGITDDTVTIASTNPAVATATPATCELSSANIHRSCLVTVTGGSTAGSAQITATSIYSGHVYTITPVNVSVSSDVVQGTLAFVETTTPIYVSESSVAYLSLTGSSGVNNETINLTSSNPAISVSPSSCTLSTTSNLCRIVLNASTNGSSTITATSVTTGAVATMQAVASSTPSTGVLSLSTQSVVIAAQSGSQSVPVTISLARSSGVHNLWISLSGTPSNPSVATPGNLTQNNVSVGNCCLSSNSESNTCTFNAVGQGSAGVSNITYAAFANATGSVTCPAKGANYGAYSPVTLQATASISQPVARTFKIINNCSNTVYFGISGGAVGNSAASQSDCPANSTYVAAKSTCFWNNPTPTSGYTLAANGGSTSVSIPASNYLGQQWSGGITGRTNCTESGLCETGGCTESGHGYGGNTGLACAITRGFGIPNSAAEFTLLNSGNDAYDVTLIGGVITPVSMQPSNAIISPLASPYQCGNAGSVAAQTGAFNGTEQVLYGSNWSPAPTVSAGTSVVTPVEAYNYVSGTSAGNPSCSTGSAGSYQPNGSLCRSGLTCGYTYDSIFNPSPSYKYTCGTRIGWISAATIFAANESTTTNVAPFGFGLSPNTSSSNPNGYTIGAWSQCKHPPFDSSYQTGSPAAQTCGGTNWDGIATPESAFQSSNATWQQEILPRITWIKQACPTCYSYQFDDNSSSFTCQTAASGSNPANGTNYTITFCPK